MTDKRNDERGKLLSLADALFDDLMAASDEDVIQEITEAGGDVEAINNHMEILCEEVILQARKNRMKAAQSGRKAAQITNSVINTVDLSVARRALRESFQQDGLSMAARNEAADDLTDEEILRKYSDLIHLGVINPEKGGS